MLMSVTIMNYGEACSRVSLWIVVGRKVEYGVGLSHLRDQRAGEKGDDGEGQHRVAIHCHLAEVNDLERFLIETTNNVQNRKNYTRKQPKLYGYAHEHRHKP